MQLAEKARIPGCVAAPRRNARILTVTVALQMLCPGAAGLPDLDRIREILQRIQEILAMGGVALATAASLLFITAWVLSHLRRPVKTAEKAKPILSSVSLGLSWFPVGLTLVAGLGVVFPPLTPFILKAFAGAVLVAALSWCLAVATLLAGGSARDLSRARKALLLSGTPWYCLVVYLATYL